MQRPFLKAQLATPNVGQPPHAQSSPTRSSRLLRPPLTSGSFHGARTEETGTELAPALLESRLFPEEKGQTEPTPTPAPASRSPGPIWTPGCPRRPEVPRSGRGSITEPGFWATFPGAEPALGTATPTTARASASPSVSAPSLAERAGTHRDTQTRSARHWPLSPKVSLRSQLPVSVNVASWGLAGDGVKTRPVEWAHANVTGGQPRWPVLVSWDHHNRNATDAAADKQQTFVSHGSRGWEGQDQGARGVSDR